MKLKTLFIITAIVDLLFGIPAIFAPGQLAGMYGLTLDNAGIDVMRLVGANLIGYAAIAWFMRNAAASEVRRAVLMGIFVGFSVNAIVFVINALGPAGTPAVWFNVVLALAFALAYGYFTFMKPASE